MKIFPWKRKGASGTAEELPEYGADFFKSDWFRDWEVLKGVLSVMLESHPEWKRILDFGCGPGVMIDLMNDRGKDYWGYDPSTEARALYLDRYGKHPDKYVSIMPNSGFDVVVSFDVFEHMEDGQVSEMLALSHRTLHLLANINRTPGIPGHINLKSDEEWIRFINNSGFEFDRSGTERLRALYLRLRPEATDAWDKNLFLFGSRVRLS